MICDLQQNTPEWLAFRVGKIGASDVPAIMGVSPYDTAYTLWERKLGLMPEKIKTYAMNRGSDLESTALRCFNETMGLSLESKVVLSRCYDWAMASLDGFDQDKIAVEIKCPRREDHLIALNNRIPDKYKPQLQHQMFVCEIDSMWYYSFDGNTGCAVFVNADKEYQKEMIEKELEFYKCIKEFIPPHMNERDYVTKHCPKFLAECAQYMSVKENLRKLEISEKVLREKLVEACSGQNTITRGLKISKSVRRGSVDYSIIPELHGINLDQFRNNPVVCWRITENKDDYV